MAFTKESRTVLALGSAVGSIFIAITILEAFPFKLTELGTSLALFITSTILVLESIYEEAKKRNVPLMTVLRELKYANIIFLVLAAVGYILAIYFVFTPTLPEFMRGFASFIIGLHAIGVIIERFR